MAAAPLVTVLLPLLRAGVDARAAFRPALILVAVAMATVATVTGGAAILVPSLRRGGREAVMPAMLVGASAGVAAVLLFPAAAGLLPTGPRVPEGLLTYAAAAAATLGLAQILAVHRLARVGGRGVVLLGAVGLVVGAAEALLPARPTLDDGVVGLVAAAFVLLVGLGAATAAGGPTGRRRQWFEDDVPPTVGPTGVVAEGSVTGSAPNAQDPAVEPAAMALLTGAMVLGVIARLVIDPSGGAADAATARLVNGSFSDAIHGTTGAAHPPLSVALVWWSRHLFGESALALRLPSLVAGLLLVPAAFATGRVLYGRRTGLVAAAVAAVGPAFVWSSATAGPAPLTALLVCLAILTMAAALRHGGVAAWVLFGLAGAAVVWAHQFGVVTVAVLHIAAGTAVIRRLRARSPEDRDAGGRTAAMAGWAVALALTMTALVALVGWSGGPGSASTPPTLEYATNAAPGGGHTPFGLAAGALSTIVGFHPPDVTSRLLALWPLGMLGAFALFGRRWSARGMLLVGLAAAPFLALLAADLAGAPRQPPLALEWLAPALPAVALAIGRATDRLTTRQGRIGLALAAVIAVLVISTADQSVRVASRAVPPSATAANPLTPPATPPATGPAPTTRR